MTRTTSAGPPGVLHGMPPGTAQAPAAAAQPGGNPAAFTRKRPAKALLARHGAALAPWWWLAQTAAAGFTAHAMPGVKAQLIAAGAQAAAAALAALRNLLKRKRSGRVKLLMWEVTAAGSGWVVVTAVIGPLCGPYHLPLLVLAAGGAAAARKWRRVAAPPRAALPQRPAGPDDPAAGKPVAPDDPRLLLFRARFCRPGSVLFQSALVFAEIPSGFIVDVVIDPESDKTVHDLDEAFAKRVAKAYDVPFDQVSVEESPVRRSAGRGRITVLTADAAMLQPKWWDGTSTYDPETGAIDLGGFVDGSPEHWLVHAPGSGAAGGLIAGMQGHGKTGTAIVVMTESAMAKLCRVCGPARACRRCQMGRIVCVWAGDPTRKPFLQLKGRADLTAWGPRACVLMMLWAQAALRARKTTEDEGWTDHLGRYHEGKGWFDPTPQVPVLQVTVDEWPQVVLLPEAQYATGAASEILSVGRKFGAAENLITLLPDLPYMGPRDVRELLLAFNVISHRSDSTSKGMIGLEGNPAHLPPGVPGLNYMAGVDRRPAVVGRVKGLREVRRPGGPEPTDARELWDRIALEPCDLEPRVMAALAPLGYTGRGQVLRDEDITEAMFAKALAAAGFGVPGGMAAPAAPAKGATAPGTANDAPSSFRHATAALKILEEAALEGRTTDVFDIMERSAQVTGGDGLSALDAERAADALVAAGDAVKTGNLYVLAPSGEPS
jgi:hypothetical protein